MLTCCMLTGMVVAAGAVVVRVVRVVAVVAAWG